VAAGLVQWPTLTRSAVLPKLCRAVQLARADSGQEVEELGLLSIFASVALVLVCIGLYGQLSYEVSRLTRVLGVRTALGAHRGEVIRH